MATIEELARLETIITLANEEGWINVREAARLEAELATLRRKAAAWDRYYELELTHVDRGHRPWLPGYVLTEIHGIAAGTREADDV